MTYSIVARDDETGELGVAVQSRAFGTRAACVWATAGVGAVASQSFAERRYGHVGSSCWPKGATRETPSTSCSRRTSSASCDRSRSST
jgi:uncharacterized Ntn-hydrolase superfamily protein